MVGKYIKTNSSGFFPMLVFKGQHALKCLKLSRLLEKGRQYNKETQT